MAASPVVETLKACRKAGNLAVVVEKWNQHTQQRQDLFGFVDVLVVRRGRRPLFVQVCGFKSDPQGTQHTRKMVTKCRDAVVDCLRGGFDIEIWIWRKHAKAIKRKFWRVEIKQITLAHFGLKKDDDDGSNTDDQRQREKKKRHAKAAQVAQAEAATSTRH